MTRAGIAAGLAGELSSYKEAAPLLRKFFNDSLEMIQAGRKNQLLFRSLEKPVDRYYEEVAGKIGLLGPEMAEQIIFVYSNLNAFRVVFMLINDQHKDMTPPELLIRPDDVLISVRVELVETLRQAQGERFIFHRAGSIVFNKKGVAHPLLTGASSTY